MVEIGDKLSGRYHITQPIGQGGMANVFLAHDLILDRDVAVKVLRFDFQDNKDAIRRFQREAMAASQLLHHNIVEVYDVDEEEGQQYIVMEYVDGQDLKSYIQANAPISLEMAVNIMSQILSGIEVAHKHGIIHRDIKPQNIMITKNNEVKITDFGIAIALTDTSITQTNTLLGSVHYLSPEQARGNNATQKSDIYALGVVLYEIITGNVPFNGESAVSVALKHFQEPFPRIKDQLDYVPQSLENVVLQATAKDPKDRYASVQAMRSDLSTSLHANRMHEPMFQPKQDLEETVVLKPIKGPKTKPVKPVVKRPERPQDLNEILYPNYDDIHIQTKPSRSRKVLKTMLALIFLVMLAFGGYHLYTEFVMKVTMPDIVNMTEEEARQALMEADLSVGQLENNWNDTVEAGRIISSKPAAGTRIERESAVDLLVSSGKEQVKIDDYVGKDYESIRRLLMDAGFIVERRGLATNNPDQVGKILAQSIDPGSNVIPEQTSITLTVGNLADSVTMQDFINLPLTMVQSFGEEFGIYVDVEYETSEFIPEGHVISQDPVNGKHLTAGDTIVVTVSTGPAEQTTQEVVVEQYVEYVPRYAEADLNRTNPLPNIVKVYIGDSNNNINNVHREIEITKDETILIKLLINRNSVGQYRIVRDGEVVYESNEVYPDVQN